jgi:hypothetical protein
MKYVLETTDHEKTVTLDAVVAGSYTMVVFVRHLG